MTGENHNMCSVPFLIHTKIKGQQQQGYLITIIILMCPETTNNHMEECVIYY